MNKDELLNAVAAFLCLTLILSGCGSSSNSDTSSGGGSSSGNVKFFFLHHSVGENLINQGNIRAVISAYNSANGSSYELWDHGYNEQGLFNGSGASVGISYDIPDDNTNPDGFLNLWLNLEQAWTSSRNRIMANYKVIAFKSCFISLENLNSVEDFNTWKSWYLGMRNYFDAHSDKLFVVVTPPPLQSAATNANSAALARQFAQWLSSSEYLGGHANIVCFDLFGALANTDNVLRPEYDSGDSHPNDAANAIIGPVFANFLCNSARSYFRQH